MNWNVRMALVTALGLGLVAGPALAAPGVDHDHAQQKDGKDKKGKDKKGKKDFVGPIKKGDYPVEQRLRPLTMAKGMVEIDGDLDYLSLPNPIKDAVGFGLDVEYGLAPTVDAHIGTGLLLSPDFDWSRALNFGAAYLAYDTKDYDLAVGVDANMFLVDGGTTSIAVTAPMRYLIGKQWDVHGTVGVPVILSPDFGINVVLSPGAGFQASENIYLALDTTVLSVSSLPNSTTHLGDILPLAFRFDYGINRQWDVGGKLTVPDLLHTDVFGVGFGAFARARF